MLGATTMAVIGALVSNTILNRGKKEAQEEGEAIMSKNVKTVKDLTKVLSLLTG